MPGRAAVVTPQAWRTLLERQDLLLQGGELQHPPGVVLRQEATQRVPAPAHTHHHVFTVEHLRTGTDQSVTRSVVNRLINLRGVECVCNGLTLMKMVLSPSL